MHTPTVVHIAGSINAVMNADFTLLIHMSPLVVVRMLECALSSTWVWLIHHRTTVVLVHTVFFHASWTQWYEPTANPVYIDTWMHDVCHCVMLSLMVVLKGMTFVMLRVFSKMVDSAAITFSTQSCVFSWDVWYCFSHFVVLVIVQWRDNDYKLTHECKGVWCFLFMRIRCKELCSVDHAALASCMM